MNTVPPACRQIRGFTFLELILVLLIIGVATAVVGPAIGNHLKSGDPRRTARELRATMEFMRVQAIQHGREEVLIVAPRLNAYWGEHGGPAVEVPPEGGILSARGRWLRQDEEVEFRFYPDGTNSGGEVRIEKRQGVQLIAYGVTLNPLLGTATIWRDES